MDVVEYIKTLRKLCKSQERCSGCVLYDKEDKCCILNMSEYTEKSVQIVEQWAKDHPVKTRQSEFLKMFPNVAMSHGVIALRPCRLDTRLDMKKDCLCSDLYSDCYECKMAYWLTEVTDND